MQYSFATNYDARALTAMAKCLRKTVRQKHSKRSHRLGWLVVILALLPTLLGGQLDGRKVIMLVVGLIVVLALVFEDRLNGFVARSRMLKGTESATALFDTENPECFFSETAVGKSEFFYSSIVALAETDRYFVFVFSKNHAQVYDKSGLTGGTAGQFREFIAERTGKPVIPVTK